MDQALFPPDFETDGSARAPSEVGDDQVAPSNECLCKSDRWVQWAPARHRAFRRETAAGTPNDQLGAQCQGIARRALTAEQSNQETHRLFALLVERLIHGGERGGVEASILHVIEADHGDVVGHADSALRELIHGAERHVVVGSNQRVEPFVPLFDEDAHGLSPRRSLKVSGDDELRVERETARLQYSSVDRVAALGLVVDGRPAHEGDAAPIMVIDEMLDGIAHARVIVDEHARHPGQLYGDAAHRQRPVALGEANEPLTTDMITERAGHDEHSVDAALTREGVHGIATRFLGVGRLQSAASEAQEVRPSLPRCVGHAGQHGRLVVMLQGIHEQSQFRRVHVGPASFAGTALRRIARPR